MTKPQADSLTTNTYRSYLIRFWQSSAAGGWRASAQCVQTGNTVLFGEIEQLLTFLQTEVNPPSPATPVTPPAAPH